MMRVYEPMSDVSGNIKEYKHNFNDWSNSIALFSDSTTWGHGLKEEDKLHNVLKRDRALRKFPRVVNNFAYPGESNWHIWMRLIDVVKEHGWPGVLVIGWTTPYRYATFENGKVNKVGHWNKADTIFNNEEDLIEYSKIIIDSVRVNAFARTNLIEWTWFPLNGFVEQATMYDFSGDDDKHPGPKSIKKLAEKIIDEL